MTKKTESADTLLLGKEIEWMKKEINEIKVGQEKLLKKMEDFVLDFDKALDEMRKENEKKYAKREDVEGVKRAITRVVALIVGGVITARLAKVGL